MITDVANLDAVKIGYLERLYDFEQTHPGQGMDSGPFLMEESGLSLVAALGLTRALDEQGLVRECNAMGSPAALLVDAGRDFVVRLRTHRADPAVRAAAARKAVLACVYDAKVKGKEMVSLDGTSRCRHGEFLGSRLTEAEVYRAYDYLAQKRLLRGHAINGSGRPTMVELTALGEDCMTDHQGDVAAFLKTRVLAQTVYQNNIGSISGGTNAIGAHVVQNVHNGIDPAGLREIVTQLTAAMPQFGDAAPQVAAAVRELEEEAAAPQPNPGRVRRVLGHVLEVAKQAGAAMVVAYLTYKAQELGILPAPPESLPTP